MSNVATSSETKRAIRRAAINRLRTRKAPRLTPPRREHAFENAYYILGHGFDSIDEPAIQVPADYAVIAKAQPGQTTKVKEKNIPLYDTNKGPYINPFTKNNLLYLVDKYKFMSIFGEGTLSPNFSFSLIAYLKTKEPNTIKILYSGILNWPFRTKNKFLNIVNEYDTAVNVSLTALLYTHIDMIVDLYKYSIYPTAKQVEDTINAMLESKPHTTIYEFIDNTDNKEHPSHKLFNVTLADLFELLPTKGVIYNFVCRSNEYSKKLYRLGNIIDESMRDAIQKKDDETLAARKGLQMILAEAVGVRAPMIRRLASASASAASANASGNASASASAISLDAATKERIKEIKAGIKALSRGAITKAALFTFLDLLIASADIFKHDHSSIHALNETLSRKLLLFLEQFEESDDIHKKYTELYTVFLKTPALKDYPEFLSRYVIDSTEYNTMAKATGPQIIAMYDHIPEYILKFVHHKKSNYTLLMMLLFIGKYSAFAHFYEKYPQLVRLQYYDYTLETVTNISRCLLHKYERTLPKTEVGYLVGFINKEKEYIDHPALRAQLADSKYQNETILDIFYPYIMHYKLHEEFASIGSKLREFGFMEAE